MGGCTSTDILTPLDQVRSGYYSAYVLVPNEDGSHRPILNLKFFNVTVARLRSRWRLHHHSHHAPTQWVASVDLKDAYFHVRVVPPHHQFLRCRWQGTIYQFGVQPFGLSSTPQVSTKTLVPLIARLRLPGVQLYAIQTTS